MLIKYLFFSYIGFAIILGLINGFMSNRMQENSIFKSLAEFSKIIFPLFALISVFVELDYYSMCFIAYLSGYYVLEAIYNLLLKMKLKDCNSNKFSPNFLETQVRTTISIFTMVYVYGSHMLYFYLISNWNSTTVVIKIFAVLGGIILTIFSVLGLALVLFDFYTMIIFPIVNNLINKTIIQVHEITLKKLRARLKFINCYFIPVYYQELKTKFQLEKLYSILKKEYTKEELSKKLQDCDIDYIKNILAQFQDCYIKS